MKTNGESAARMLFGPTHGGVFVQERLIGVSRVVHPVAAMHAEEQIQLARLAVGIMKDHASIRRADDSAETVFGRLQQMNARTAAMHRNIQHGTGVSFS